jgi:hypothetical protein
MSRSVIRALTKSRSASYHRGNLLKFIIASVCLYVLWEPIRPAREVTADVLSYTASQIRR